MVGSFNNAKQLEKWEFTQILSKNFTKISCNFTWTVFMIYFETTGIPSFYPSSNLRYGLQSSLLRIHHLFHFHHSETEKNLSNMPHVIPLGSTRSLQKIIPYQIWTCYGNPWQLVFTSGSGCKLLVNLKSF